MSDKNLGQSESRKWKDKYLSSLENSENQEQDFENQLDVFRRGLVRVSLAADGVDNILDEYLAELRDSLRGSVDISKLESLFEKIEIAVRKLDDKKQQSFSALEVGYKKIIQSLLIEKIPRKIKRKIKAIDRTIGESVASSCDQVTLIKEVGDVLDLVLEQLIDAASKTGGGGFWDRFKPNSKMSTEESEKQLSTEKESATKKSSKHDDVDGLELDASSAATDQNNPHYQEQIAKERVVGIIIALLDQLLVPEVLKERELKIRSLLRKGIQWEEMPETLSETISLVTGSRLAAQREFETFLMALNGRLTEIHHFIAENRDAENEDLDSTDELNQQVNRHVGSIQASLSQVSEVGDLKKLVQEQLDNIVETVDIFRQDKLKKNNGVIEKLNALGDRLEAMETESSRLKETIAEQREQALRDALTGLPNRQAYIEYAAKELARRERYDSDLTLVIADVDHFKRINDSYGHLSGDKVLKAISKEMMKRLRASDFIGRFGGEEFVILMPETDCDAAMKAINNLREAVGNCPFHFREERVPITVSFGLTQVREGDTIETAFARADKALYEAKEQGRNRVNMG
ncbi:MAG: GGDEF domain-containing protein [Pseudomonadales bacterium]|nr:GGDEF domain-containing protein [Pseudomonadales bacterium]